MSLTVTRSRVLAAIRAHVAAHPYPPTVRELAAATGLGPSTAHYHLRGLEAAGLISRVPGSPRAITITDNQGVKP